MNSVYRIALLLLFISLAVLLAADGEEKSDTGQYAFIQVSGRVRLVGNEPFTELVITGADKEWYIAEDEGYKLKDLQHNSVTVKGIETVMPLIAASGVLVGERRILSNIEIIKVE
jgi:hypothetical protein